MMSSLWYRTINCVTSGLSPIISSVMHPSTFIMPHISLVQQVRGRKRSVKKPLSRQEKLERRLKREAREAARKEGGFIARINKRKSKKVLSISLNHPGRYIKEEENDLPEKSSTNITIRGKVKTEFYPIAEALYWHRKFQQPSIYNNSNAKVRLRMELNMETERMTKLVKDSTELLPIPHPFNFDQKRAILAFVKNVGMQQFAVEKGADAAFGPDIVRKIIKGQFPISDYDFCVAHTDMASHILPLRGILKSRFPTKLNGGLDDDLETVIKIFKDGVKLNIVTDKIYPKWGVVDTVIGMLNMSDEEIEANTHTIVKATCRHRNPALGAFINRAVLMVIPGTPFFPIDINHMLPVPTAEEIATIEKRQTKKRKKTEIEETASINEDSTTPEENNDPEKSDITSRTAV